MQLSPGPCIYEPVKKKKKKKKKNQNHQHYNYNKNNARYINNRIEACLMFPQWYASNQHQRRS